MKGAYPALIGVGAGVGLVLALAIAGPDAMVWGIIGGAAFGTVLGVIASGYVRK